MDREQMREQIFLAARILNQVTVTGLISARNLAAVGEVLERIYQSLGGDDYGSSGEDSQHE